MQKQNRNQSTNPFISENSSLHSSLETHQMSKQIFVWFIVWLFLLLLLFTCFLAPYIFSFIQNIAQFNINLYLWWRRRGKKNSRRCLNEWYIFNAHFVFAYWNHNSVEPHTTFQSNSHSTAICVVKQIYF